ncbi:hypothetical protein NQ117_07890 [Paenibacillus sp. SC116]|uniref:hypothetical protein n=1 Tax=Paenibacillus sp. SC116 TaxID=2968986 RepID=UPI00215B19AC|nr:hypothetical protein [Paenibacillus sp. SC116]MCR8843604.1 hypothetical protein [Paenibacillus sp. SC116]
MKKASFGLIAIIMLLVFATSAFAATASASTTRTETGVTTHTGGNLALDYSAYDSRIHGWMYIEIYRVTSSGDVAINAASVEGGRPTDNGIRSGTVYSDNLPAGTYKYVITIPSNWMGPSVSWRTY